ncbi:hypothetical protein ACLOAU_19905 [Niabella sp. CJ426]|jgi:hypothetical protein|uniref:hypothetical protein n=1 Tax=Niabella sp. CJ426 TaxID=3393740 RepID=UPI003D04FD90
MKKSYLVIGLLVLMMAVSCGDNENTNAAGETSEMEEAPINNAAQDSTRRITNDDVAIEAYKNNKSSITSSDIDLNDPTYTSRTTILYHSEENGKNLTVVYGFKKTNDGIAIIQLEGEAPVTLKQSKPLNVESVEFASGNTILTRRVKSVELNDNGEIVVYNAIQ